MARGRICATSCCTIREGPQCQVVESKSMRAFVVTRAGEQNFPQKSASASSQEKLKMKQLVSETGFFTLGDRSTTVWHSLRGAECLVANVEIEFGPGGTDAKYHWMLYRGFRWLHPRLFMFCHFVARRRGTRVKSQGGVVCLFWYLTKNG